MFDLPADNSAPAAARALVRAVAGPPGVSRDAEVAALLISEVVTNAVRHGFAPIAVEIACAASALRVEVHDSSHELPARNRHPDAAGGYGLVLVDSLAARWGAESEPDGKVVWFEVPYR
jgi:anti-sigma regulatory factor (Ser/Thr protein kinase)